MSAILDRLCEKGLLVSDGAWGTRLQARGLASGDCPEAWNLDRPDDVRAVANEYVVAGSDLVLTNTFGGNEIKLAKYGREAEVEQLNLAGARLSVEAAGGHALVAASVGPTGEFVEPYGDMTEEEMEAVFARQIAALAQGGMVRAVCIETMTAIEEACCAVRAARRVDAGLEVIVTMTFDPTAHGFRTMMGVAPERAAAELSEAGADILGTNCGNGSQQMVGVIAALRSATDKPLLVHSNAGVPELVNGQTVFRESPATMAEYIKPLRDAGAQIFGGCCGTTPAHIAALRAAVDALR